MPTTLTDGRRAGILLHPTSLPSPYGIGDLGPAAEAFLRWAAAAGQRLWQVLPLGPPGYGDSPYGVESCFAVNPLLISPDALAADGLLPAGALDSLARSETDGADFALARVSKGHLLRASFAHCTARAPEGFGEELAAFTEAQENKVWLEDWCLFAALKGHHGGKPWTSWDAELRGRTPAALARARTELRAEVRYHRFVQFLLARQWRRVRWLAGELGFLILGDVPIYATLDSADVWAHQDLFELDGDGRPLAVSGVPPDAFSSDGQLWGTPVYRWDRHRETGFAWWIDRLRAALGMADLARLDHFRGFEAYWRVPRGEVTAKAGAWSPGPGLPLFTALEAALGALPFIAEDLGVITPEVEALLAATGLPRMKVLQFAFSEPDSLHLPHHHRPNDVVYTGTHDNDTARGWYLHLSPEEKARVGTYLGIESAARAARGLIRAASTSAASLAIVPLQDVLDLGSSARMNTPGRESGNWRWRARESDIRDGLGTELLRLAEVTGRLPKA